jgi:hypothetical protein
MPRRSLVVSNASRSWGSPTVSVTVTKPSAGVGMFSASPTAYAGPRLRRLPSRQHSDFLIILWQLL